MSSLMSIEELMSLTVPKLKAELTRLNQPLAGLKRKAQLVEALTVSAASDEVSGLKICVGSGEWEVAVGARSRDADRCELGARQIYASRRRVKQMQHTAVLSFALSIVSSGVKKIERGSKEGCKRSTVRPSRLLSPAVIVTNHVCGWSQQQWCPPPLCL